MELKDIIIRKNNNKSSVIGIIGLGYVGLPLAIEFGKLFDVVGFDINQVRVNQLKNFNDSNREVLLKDFKKS